MKARMLFACLMSISLNAMKEDSIVEVKHQDDEEKLREFIVNSYIVEHMGEFQPSLVRTIKRHIKDEALSSVLMAACPEERRIKVMNSVVLSATMHALKHQKHKTNQRWTRKKSAILATITGLSAAAIASGIALLIHYVP
jgi:hypothetical protein